MDSNVIMQEGNVITFQKKMPPYLFFSTWEYASLSLALTIISPLINERKVTFNLYWDDNIN